MNFLFQLRGERGQLSQRKESRASAADGPRGWQKSGPESEQKSSTQGSHPEDAFHTARRCSGSFSKRPTASEYCQWKYTAAFYPF